MRTPSWTPLRNTLLSKTNTAHPGIGWVLAGFGALLITVGVLSWLNALTLGVIAVTAVAIAYAGLTNLRAALYVYAFSIPFEVAFELQGPIATLSRATGIVLLLSFALHYRSGLRISALPVPMWGFFLWSLLSLFWADSVRALPTATTLVQLGIATFIVSSTVREDREAGHGAVAAFVYAAAIVGAIGAVAFLSGDGTTRTAAFVGQNPAHYASVMLAPFLAGLSVLVSGEPIGRVRSALGGSALLGIGLIGLLASATRGAIVGAAIGSIVLLIRSASRSRMRPGATVTAIAGIVLLAAAVWSAAPSNSDLVSGRFQSAIETGGSGRLDIWSVGLGIFRDNPILGVGLGDFESSFTAAAIDDPLFDTDIYVPLDEARNPHNVFLGIAAELGLIGFLLWCAALAVLLFGPASGGIPSSTYAIVWALLAHGLVIDISARKYFWLFIGLAAGFQAAGLKSEMTSGQIEQQPVPTV